MRQWQLSPAVRARVVRMAMEGHSYAEIVRSVRVSAGSVVNVLRHVGGTLRRVDRVSIDGRLSLIDRTEIYAGVARGYSGAVIARRMGKHPSTVTRQIALNGGRAVIDRWRHTGEHCERPDGPR